MEDAASPALSRDGPRTGALQGRHFLTHPPLFFSLLPVTVPKHFKCRSNASRGKTGPKHLRLILVFLLRLCISYYILWPSCGRAYMEARLRNRTGWSLLCAFSHSTFDYRTSRKKRKPASSVILSKKGYNFNIIDTAQHETR